MEAKGGKRFEALRITSTNRFYAMDWCRQYVGRERVGSWAVKGASGTLYMTHIEFRDLFAVIGGRDLEVPAWVPQ